MNGETILVVEDDGLIALYLTELLEKTGYLVGSASSGEMALQELKESPLTGSHPDGYRAFRIA